MALTGAMSGSGICWAICKSAPHPRQITMPTPQHSVFYKLDALPAAQPTASTHWRHKRKMTDWQWHQLDHMQIICTSLKTDNHTSTTSPFYSVRAALKACTHMTYNKTFYLVVIKEWKHSILQYEPAFREPCRQQYILFCIVNKPLSNVTRYLIPTWYVPSRLLYSTFANLLTVPWMRLAFSFCVCNSLDNITRDSQTVSTFKRHLKTHLFQSAFNIIL